MPKSDRTAAETTAESYYDSDDADNFYEKIWGGEDLHIGVYDADGLTIREASDKTVELMASKLKTIDANSRVIDLGAGYGGSMRFLARHYGCHVTCVNLSERQNERNRMLTTEQGLGNLIDVVYGSFEDIPASDNSFDIVWSQDSFLHSGDRSRVLEEIDRVLVPGGELLFTDPMQTDDCPPDVLQPVYDRLELDSLGTPGWYREQLEGLGFEPLEFVDMVAHLRTHYDTVATTLAARQNDFAGDISPAYINRMLTGLKNWVDAADNGYLAWGIMHFKKR